MPQLTDFSSLLFDVDGTLANHDYHITNFTKIALHNLFAAGYTTGVCTGRHYAQMGEYVLGNFAKDALHVVSGGAQVINSRGEVIWQRAFSADLSAEIIAATEAHELTYLTHAGSQSYASESVREWFQPSMPGISLPRPLEELPAGAIPMLVVFQPTPHFLEYLDGLGEVMYKEMLSTKHGPYLDITAKGVTKLTGLKEWAKLQNIPLEKVIGFGDSNNDIEFLQHVGWSVGMGDATPEIKALAKKIIGNVDQNGLAIYLEKILKGSPL
jgi:Cof subfamily protein (haloacid dehalogenase superfamily)